MKEQAKKTIPLHKILKESITEHLRTLPKQWPLPVAVAIIQYLVLPKLLKAYWPRDLNYPRVFVFFVTILAAVVGLIVGNLIYYTLYKLRLPSIEKFKITHEPWPWDKDYEKWRATLWKTLKGLFFYYLGILPFMLFVSIFVVGSVSVRYDLESFPTTGEILRQFVFFLIVEDFAFYWCHRLLHHPKLYSRIHKYHHEYTEPVSICASYAHPLEQLFGFTLPSSLGVMILGNDVHLATQVLWTFIRILGTSDGHCGYDLHWNPAYLLPWASTNTVVGIHLF
jgi:sterol desaturase/sphingolipid hydroxylase (fatty acid hydroxylase superfamily)